jgi:hypothetical protein
MEATLFSAWIYDTLKPYAEKLVMGHPARMKAATTLGTGCGAPDFGMDAKFETLRNRDNCSERRFEWQPVSRGREHAKLSEKRMHFVREKRDKPPAGASMRGCVSLSPLFYLRCSRFTAKSFVS